jgi:hypothetical protein
MNIAPPKMTYDHKYWLDFKISQEDWTALARLSHYAEVRGIKTVCLSKLNGDRPGLELVFQSYARKPIVLNLGGNGDARVEFYRRWDRGPEQIKSCGNIREHWEDIGRLMVNLR